jgi:phage gpG-like protein
MADGLSVKLVGSKELQRRLKKMNPAQNARITTPALLESMQLTLRDARLNRIIRGGSGSPHATKLTSRGGRLRGSLAGNQAIDLNRRLRWVEGGTDVIYGAVHEKGGTISIPGHIRTHKKTGFRIGVRPHTAKYPARPFLAPALAATRGQFDDIFRRWWAREGEVG